ncbi:MAG: riboflavin biosynthesis protein RibF [Coriobacteriia bacterium]|nr:riboflavin biosynthesis protein RibF [Coriobacteriia bacterium]
MKRVIHFPHDRHLGAAVVALGAFDGVHVGHRALLGAAADHAHRLGVTSIAVTFDRDPDEILHPYAASPRLLTAAERFDRILQAGVDAVVVVPFTDATAALQPEAFLDDIICGCCDPVAVRVGEGFRFGAGGAGDIDTLYVWGVEHNIDVKPHPLIMVDGATVSSTRIRALVAHGDVASAAALLDAPHRVLGEVHHGRGLGADLGFATANVNPDTGLAIPADGVYAGRVLLQDGSSWPAAISVGTPPSFPEARDYLEAHLIGFAGDLYEQRIVIEFLDRLRDQKAFPSERELSAAIAHDIESALLVQGDAAPVTDLAPSDELLVDDPRALEEATAAVSRISGEPDYGDYDDSWVAVFGPHRMSTLFTDGGVGAALVTGPLRAAGIPFVWDPFPPDASQSARPDFNWLREFTLLVPADSADEARSLLLGGARRL